MTDQFTYDAAPYVLGALSPEERLAFEAHLAECPSCELEVREFAGLPGLLSRLPAEDLAVVLGEQPEPPPPSLLPRLEFAVRRERRTRRWRVTVIGLAAACLAAIGTVVVVDQTRAATPTAPVVQAIPFRPIDTVPVVANASLVAEAWGTAIEMHCMYTGHQQAGEDPKVYTLRAEDKAGNKETVSTWTVLFGKEVVVHASTAIPRDQLSSLKVLSPTGKTLLELDL